MKLKNFFLNIQFIFRPSFWLMNDPYSPLWDSQFNKLLDVHEFTNITDFTAFLGDQKIWITNYPYACFHPYGWLGKEEFRPSRLTILRAYRKLKPHLITDPYIKYKQKLTRSSR